MVLLSRVGGRCFRRARRCSMGKVPIQAQCFAITGPTSSRTTAQLARLFERSRANTAKLTHSSDDSLEGVRRFDWARAAVASAVSSSSGIALAELLQRRLDASEGRRERWGGTPRAHRRPETLHGREQRASLVVQLVCRIARVGSHCRPGWHPRGSLEMGSNIQSPRRDMRKSPQDAWYYACRRRSGEAKPGLWESRARARARRSHRRAGRRHDGARRVGLTGTLDSVEPMTSTRSGARPALDARTASAPEWRPNGTGVATRARPIPLLWLVFLTNALVLAVALFGEGSRC
jgi:hypothetical protein